MTSKNSVTKTDETARVRASRILKVDRISGERTIRVVSVGSVIHPIYKKRHTITSRMLADTGSFDVKVGDTVRIVETRPISKRKAWRVVEIVAKLDSKI